MNIRISVKGVEKIQKLFFNLPKELTQLVIRSIGKYLLGDIDVDAHTGGNRGRLRDYASYKFVKRAKAYGSTGAKFENGTPVPDGYFSAKQFRYVAWMTEGFTKNMGSAENRTGKTASSWKFTEGTSRAVISNDSTGGYYTMHDNGQARQPAMVGWNKASRTVMNNMAGATMYTIKTVDEFLRSQAAQG